MIGVEGQGAPVLQWLWIASRHKLPIHSNDMGAPRPRWRRERGRPIPSQSNPPMARIGTAARPNKAARRWH